ncbi:hypothetical protein [Mesorhizobium sp. Cs1299R1N1]|uniref:hypothetical protein n=1 Tax=Mesorhizobium sp. Cs1299R1N1 TaxID=3015172 RepID=UPI00301DDFCB
MTEAAVIAPTPGIVVSRRMSSSRFVSPTAFELVDLTHQRLNLIGDSSQSPIPSRPAFSKFKALPLGLIQTSGEPSQLRSDS